VNPGLPNISLQRTAPCGLAAELGSFGGTWHRLVAVASFGLAGLVSVPYVAATSGRNVYFELAGLKSVSVSVDTAGLNGLNRDEVLSQVRDHLAKANIATTAEDSGAPFLLIRVERNMLPSPCPGVSSVAVSMSLREPITILRIRKLKEALGTTWSNTGFVNLLPDSEAGDYTKREILSMVDGFASDVLYATETVRKPGRVTR
jgi:hypothetical protein